MTAALAAGTLSIGGSTGCSADNVPVDEAVTFTLNGTYTVENLATFSHDNLDVRIEALDHRDMGRTVHFSSTEEPLSIELCADLIVQTLTEQGLPAGRHGDLILIERTRPVRETSSRRPGARSREPIEPADHEGHITMVDEGSYTIDRSFMVAELTDLDGLMRQARIIPHHNTEGNTVGYRISGIRRGRTGDALGFQNGDILHSVSGQTLDSMEGAMDAYMILKDADEFTVELSRRGQRQTLSYAVQ